MPTPEELLKYHPERFKTSRPQAVKLTRDMRSTRLENLSQAEYMKLFNQIAKLYNDEIMAVEREQRPLAEDANAIMCEIYFSCQLYSLFCKNGKNIFDISGTLFEMFSNTEVGSVPLSALKLPYDFFYLHFGRQESLAIGDGYYLDGAYISNTDGNISMSLTTVQDVDYRRSKMFFQEREQFFLINLDCSLIFDEAFKHSFEKKLDADRKAQNANKEAKKITGGSRYQVVSNQIGTPPGQDWELIQPLARQALQAIVNSLCFICAKPDLIEKEYPDSIPVDLAQELSKVKNNFQKKRRIDQALARLGYTRINFCGRGLTGIGPTGESTRRKTMDGYVIEDRTRVGHWRLQPVGPRNASTTVLKWIYPTIAPVRVKAEAKGEGHIYEVDKTSN